MSALAGSLAIIAALVCLLASIGMLRARSAADALHFTAPAVIVAGPLLVVALTLDPLSGSFTAQAWATLLTALATSPIVAHATLRMLHRRREP